MHAGSSHATSLAFPGGRRFLPVPSSEEAGDGPRPIWEVDPGTVFVAVGVLVERGDLEAVLREAQADDYAHCRDDLLFEVVVRGCGHPGRIAEAVAQLLDARCAYMRRRVLASPLGALATWWLGSRAEADGRELTALLWSLSRDRRFIVRPLCDMVHGDLWVRALRLLAGPNTSRAGSP